MMVLKPGFFLHHSLFFSLSRDCNAAQHSVFFISPARCRYFLETGGHWVDTLLDKSRSCCIKMKTTNPKPNFLKQSGLFPVPLKCTLLLLTLYGKPILQSSNLADFFHILELFSTSNINCIT